MSLTRAQADQLVVLGTLDRGLHETRPLRTGQKLATGFTELDHYFRGGLLPGKLIFIGGGPEGGKAQPISAKVLTPTGWVRMGDLRVGDLVIGLDGRPHKVLGVYEQGVKRIYRVETNDGAATRCCDDHLWSTTTRNDRRKHRGASARALKDIRRTLHRSDGGLNHALPYVAPVQFARPAGDIPIDPWLLGVWLGDGGFSGSCAKFHNPEPDLRRRFRRALPIEDMAVRDDKISLRVRRIKRNNRPSTLSRQLGSLGLRGKLSHERFVPGIFLHASVLDRLHLLQGLLDTDGYVPTRGRRVEYVTTSPRLRDDVAFLVRSLGGDVHWIERRGAYKKQDGTRVVCRVFYRMWLRLPDAYLCPVSSQKHLARWRSGYNRKGLRLIKKITPAGREHCRCIQIDHANGLYVTDDFLVTHNTATALAMTLELARQGCVIGWLANDAGLGDLFERIALAAGVDVDVFRAGDATAEQQVQQFCQASLPHLFAYEEADVTVVCEAMKLYAPESPRVLVLDQMTIEAQAEVTSGRGPNGYEKLAAYAHELKQATRETATIVIALAQVSMTGELWGGVVQQHRPDVVLRLATSVGHDGLIDSMGIEIQKNRIGNRKGKLHFAWDKERNLPLDRLLGTPAPSAQRGPNPLFVQRAAERDAKVWDVLMAIAQRHNGILPGARRLREEVRAELKALGHGGAQNHAIDRLTHRLITEGYAQFAAAEPEPTPPDGTDEAPPPTA